MTSLIAKLRSVARYGVAVFLAAVSCFSVNAAYLNCDTSGEPFKGDDGQWYVTVICYGDLSERIDVKIDPEQASEGSGGCTNCTKMTPAECEQLRANLLNKCVDIDSRLDTALIKVSSAEDELIALQNNLMALQDEGRQFVYASSASSLAPSGDTAGVIAGALATPQGPYIYYNPSAATTKEQHVVFGGVNSIYNYFNQSVNPALQEITDNNIYNLSESMNEIKVELYSAQTDVISVRGFVNGMDCSVCSDGSGGGSSTPSTPSTPSTGCPCSEVLEAIKTILEDLRTKQNKIQRDVETIREKVEYWDNYLKWIAEAVAPMGTNFLAAVNYKTLDGISFQMKTLDETLKQSGKFDFEEFGKLGWYSRVEYLLMSVAGVFSITNRPDDVDKDSLQQHVDDITDEGETLEDRVDDVKSGFDEINSSVSAFFAASKIAFASHSANGNVSLMTGWLDNHHLEFTIDSNVISVARTVTSLFWTVGFAFVLYLLVFRGFAFVVSVFKFWIVQAQGFLK